MKNAKNVLKQKNEQKYFEKFLQGYPLKKIGKNMFNLDEENIQFALGKRALVFGIARNPRMLCFFNPDVEIRGIIFL